MRWCQLNPATGTLSICKDERGRVELELPINYTMQVRAFDDPTCSAEARVFRFRKPMGFEIQAGPGHRNWYFDAGTTVKRELWMRSLMQVTGNYN